MEEEIKLQKKIERVNYLAKTRLKINHFSQKLYAIGRCENKTILDIFTNKEFLEKFLENFLEKHLNNFNTDETKTLYEEIFQGIYQIINSEIKVNYFPNIESIHAERYGNFVVISKHKKYLLDYELFLFLKESYIGPSDNFESELYRLLLRYETFGNAYQDFLSMEIISTTGCEKYLNVECFSSPFTHFLEKYGSMFPDIDKNFKSLGNFFEWNTEMFEEAFMLADPPFIKKVVDETIKKILTFLDSNKPFSFLLVIPKEYNIGKESILGKYIVKTIHADKLKAKMLTKLFSKIDIHYENIFFIILQNQMGKMRYPIE